MLNYSGDAMIECRLYQVDTISSELHCHKLVVSLDDDKRSLKDAPHTVHVNDDDGYEAV